MPIIITINNNNKIQLQSPGYQAVELEIDNEKVENNLIFDTSKKKKKIPTFDNKNKK